MKILFSAFIYFASPCEICAEVTALSWETKLASPAQTVSGDAQKLLPAFRLGLATLPESSVVALALSQPALLGVTATQSATLTPLVAKRYELIAASPEYSKAPSQLSYCYSHVRPTRGSALMHIPTGVSHKSPSLVFLHGYGGSFLWYLHWMAEAFPHHIIIAPAYGISPAEIPATYLVEAIDAASAQLGFPLEKPTLVGLSAGGFGACRAYLKTAESFERLVCLGAYPPDDTIRRFTRTHNVRFVVGAREPFVTNGRLRSHLQTIRLNCPAAALSIIPDADHFFLLSHPDEARKALLITSSPERKVNKTDTGTGSKAMRSSSKNLRSLSLDLRSSQKQ